LKHIEKLLLHESYDLIAKAKRDKMGIDSERERVRNPMLNLFCFDGDDTR